MGEQITQSSYEAALDRGKEQLQTALQAESVRYHPEQDIIELVIFRPRCEFSLKVKRQDVAEFATVPMEAMAGIELSAIGDGIDLDTHDIHIDLEGLLLDLDMLPAGALTRRFARKGGQAATEAKRMSARLNGQRGGRPSKATAAV